MRRRVFIRACTSVGAVAIAGCSGGKQKKTVEIVESHIERKDENTMSETVFVVGAVRNVTEEPVDITLEVTFYRDGAVTNTVEKTLNGAEPKTESEFSVEAPSIGRTARQINGYDLKLESGGYSTATSHNTDQS